MTQYVKFSDNDSYQPFDSEIELGKLFASYDAQRAEIVDVSDKFDAEPGSWFDVAIHTPRLGIKRCNAFNKSPEACWLEMADRARRQDHTYIEDANNA
jgi:hypothetical protein